MRRRRNRSTWFPILPTQFGEGNGVTWYANTISVPAGAQPGDFINGVDCIPLVPDQSSDSNASASLRDLVEGQDYLCERVVGKVNVSYSQASDSSVPGAVIVGAGLAVLPVGDETQEVDLPPEDYNPLIATNAQAPWMWRRTWVLSNASGIQTETALGSRINTIGPQANWQNGDGYSGTHVDTKGAKRRIRREQRLFFCITVSPLVDGFGTASAAGGILYAYDFRVLGSMRKANNRSTFK